MKPDDKMREIVHIQAGQCGNQIGAKVNIGFFALRTTISGKLLAYCFVPQADSRECDMSQLVLLSTKFDNSV